MYVIAIIWLKMLRLRSIHVYRNMKKNVERSLDLRGNGPFVGKGKVMEMEREKNKSANKPYAWPTSMPPPTMGL